jgi:hypothetical protein
MLPSNYAAMSLGAIILFAGVYDYAAGLAWGYDGTLTSLIRDWFRRWPVLPFAAGMLAMHLLEGVK